MPLPREIITEGRRKEDENRAKPAVTGQELLLVICAIKYRATSAVLADFVPAKVPFNYVRIASGSGKNAHYLKGEVCKMPPHWFRLNSRGFSSSRFALLKYWHW